MLFEVGFHPVEGVLQPGNQSDRRRLAVDADGLREVCPFQREVRRQPRVMPAGLTPVPIVSDEPISTRTRPARKSANSRCLSAERL
jgi:hypothetical protein